MNYAALLKQKCLEQPDLYVQRGTNRQNKRNQSSLQLSGAPKEGSI